MFAKLLGWLAGGGIAAIGKQVNRAIEIREQAKNDQARIEADKHLAEILAQQRILLAEQGHWLTRWIRPGFVFPFVIYDAKIILWDRVFGWGSTDPLSPELFQLQMIVFGAYFLTRPIEKAFRK